MEKLPIELLDLVASHLQSPLAPYATISRQWQKTIEAKTFHSLCLDSDQAPFQQFHDIVTGSHRRERLKEIWYMVWLPNIEQSRVYKLKGRRENAANSAAYTQAIFNLLVQLRAWEEVEPRKNLGEFTLSLSADIGLEDEPESFDCTIQPTLEHRNASGYAIVFDCEAVQSQSFPPVPWVTDLYAGWDIDLHPSFILKLTDAFPGLESFDFTFRSPGRRLPSRRREFRSSLGHALLHGCFESLRCVELSWQDRDPQNQASDPGDMSEPGSQEDLLSMGLRRLSQLPHLQHLIITGRIIVSPAVFALIPSATVHGDLPLWPSLVTMDVEMSLTTPDGKWHFAGNPL
jgi:hypothetical protein